MIPGPNSNQCRVFHHLSSIILEYLYGEIIVLPHGKYAAHYSLYHVWLELISQPDSYQRFAGISNLKSNIFCILSTAVPDSALSIVDDLCFHSSLSLRRCALPQWEQRFAFDLSLDTFFYTGFPVQIFLH